MEVQIPSPSVFLRKSPVASPAPVPAKKQPAPKPKQNASSKAAPKSATAAARTVQDGSVTKPKQSKSRNGCMTCKKKRLKCDEVKPHCLQCQKRSVTCEGYNKDYKWKPFEETSFVFKPGASAGAGAGTKRKPVRSSSFGASSAATRPVDIVGAARSGLHIEDPSHDLNAPQTWSPGLNAAFSDATYAFGTETSANNQHPDATVKFDKTPSPPFHLSPDPPMPSFEAEMTPGLTFADTLDPFSDSTTTTTTAKASIVDDGSQRSFSGSPQLIDILLPGTDMKQPPDPSEPRPPMSPLPYQPSGFDDNMVEDEDFDEEIMRSEQLPHLPPSSMFDPADVNGGAFNSFRSHSPTPSETSSTSSKSSVNTILAEPRLAPSSTEMLMLRFDQQTCGILSVKDGPTENPWRTLVWPLARDSPALLHAILSMTAFHGTHEHQALQIAGVRHMNRSVKRLAHEMENMRLDSALATSLALAFSESWDRHISTGLQHLKGAKIMVNSALIKHRRDMMTGQLTVQDAHRLKFLCNTFIYMDVIARLTSEDEGYDMNFDEILGAVNQPFSEQQAEVDPLMGCALSLFPLIGRAASLIQRVRQMGNNSVSIVGEAAEIQEQLRQWQVPNMLTFERPEDPNSEVQHSIQTAEAYRYATLLYLHQAVPEIPSPTTDLLAEKVVKLLATVPLSSRATIIHIFPLFAASCEITDYKDRAFISNRWMAMMARLKIGNVWSCWSVLREVWRRRDDYEQEKLNRQLQRLSSRGIPGGVFMPPFTNGPHNLKRKASTVDMAMNESAIFGAPGGPGGPDGPDAGDVDKLGRPIKRRFTTDSMVMNGMRAPVPPFNVGGPGATGPSGPSQRSGVDDGLTKDEDPEYTIHGRLHWLGVMRDWKWEVFLG